MAMSEVIAQIDAEIAKLQQAKALLSGLPSLTPAVVKGKRGRPKGSTNAPKVETPSKPARKLSAAGRKAIADAMKRRWAERKKATA